ncbi:sperm acrosome membrane-associated protein 6 isoform X2 [Cervus canadensis]|uniref:sperm acrosome membrane-associated protein 6 isoform X2 n=1 Tax=Cervus canadensis TaxID=1574408 RepID=UPI001CA35D14|nr:sperm acrosome membrane-associated protein 6 isoform X2 [Cervus canadensis]
MPRPGPVSSASRLTRSASRFARSSPAWTAPTSGSVRRPSQTPLRGCWTLRSVRRPHPLPSILPSGGGDRGYTEGGTREAWRDLRGTETQRWENGGLGSRDRRPRDDHLRAVVPGEVVPPSPCLPPPDYEERGQLHDAFTQMTHSLQEMAAAQGSFRVAFLHAAEKMQKIILQLKEVQACIPPCVQELTVTRGRQAMFSCTVNFQLPKEEITYSWKFAGAPDSGPDLLPRYSAGPRLPGADPAGAAHAPRDLLLRDHARPAPPGAALLLS